MPARGSQNTASKSSQQSITTAFKRLSEHLNKAWKREGEIEYAQNLHTHSQHDADKNTRAPDALNQLKEILRTHRQKSTTIEPKFLIDVASKLERDGDDLCSRINESIFCLIVEAIFQTDYCVENERVLYLLAVCEPVTHREVYH